MRNLLLTGVLLLASTLGFSQGQGQFGNGASLVAGTVTSVNAGNGLSGGGAGPSPTLSLNLPGTANALTFDNGAGLLSDISPPTTNCPWQVIYPVVANISVAPTVACPGVAVSTPATPYPLASTDRATYLRLTGGSTFAITLCQITGTCANNLPFVVGNFNSSTLTFTANAADKVNNSATGGTLPVLSNFAVWMYQDSSTAPGNWWPIRVPMYEAFGNTCANSLNWSTTAGFGCNSLGVDSGAANAYVVTGTAITTLTATGIIGCFNPTHASTAASTVAINGLAATSIIKFTNAAIIANDITVGNPACVLYNGSTFTLINPVQSTGTSKIVLSAGPTISNATFTGTITGSNTVRLTADSSGITATTPGTTFLTLPTLLPSNNYSFNCELLYSQATAAVLDGLSVQAATNAATRWDAWGTMYTADPITTTVVGSQNNAANVTTTTATPIVSATPAAISTVYQARLSGTIQVGASVPTVNIAAFTGNASDAITMKAGSFCAVTP